MTDYKFSADLPRVARSLMVTPGEIVLMQRHVFEDNRPRLVIHTDASDKLFTECEKAIVEIDKQDDDHDEMMRKVKIIQDLMGGPLPSWSNTPERRG